VGVDEVAKAMRSSRPGTAPGPDGLPLLVYKRCHALLVPLLTRVFSAIGRCGNLPTGFLDGVIVGIDKGGVATDPANYRPITLLNTDYRLLARVFADRLQPALQGAISPTQTAFMRGRRIGENILTIQLLLHALMPRSRAAAALRDFVKAYDTVDREFLFKVMAAMGVGDGFMHWVRLLLGGTHACAVMNGYV
jgi:hypothetical protein